MPPLTSLIKTFGQYDEDKNFVLERNEYADFFKELHQNNINPTERMIVTTNNQLSLTGWLDLNDQHEMATEINSLFKDKRTFNNKLAILTFAGIKDEYEQLSFIISAMIYSSNPENTQFSFEKLTQNYKYWKDLNQCDLADLTCEFFLDHPRILTANTKNAQEYIDKIKMLNRSPQIAIRAFSKLVGLGLNCSQAFELIKTCGDNCGKKKDIAYQQIPASVGIIISNFPEWDSKLVTTFITEILKHFGENTPIVLKEIATVARAHQICVYNFDSILSLKRLFGVENLICVLEDLIDFYNLDESSSFFEYWNFVSIGEKHKDTAEKLKALKLYKEVFGELFSSGISAEDAIALNETLYNNIKSNDILGFNMVLSLKNNLIRLGFTGEQIVKALSKIIRESKDQTINILIYLAPVISQLAKRYKKLSPAELNKMIDQQIKERLSPSEK